MKSELETESAPKQFTPFALIAVAFLAMTLAGCTRGLEVGPPTVVVDVVTSYNSQLTLDRHRAYGFHEGRPARDGFVRVTIGASETGGGSSGSAAICRMVDPNSTLAPASQDYCLPLGEDGGVRFHVEVPPGPDGTHVGFDMLRSEAKPTSECFRRYTVPVDAWLVVLVANNTRVTVEYGIFCGEPG